LLLVFNAPSVNQLLNFSRINVTSQDMNPRLGVNIDHVATLRQLRGTPYPNLLEIAQMAVQAGADQITVHLREDRRHIQDSDVTLLKKSLSVPLNLEMAVAPAMVKFAVKVRPEWTCLVPEKRKEVTTEGGLNIEKNKRAVGTAISQLKKAGIRVSCFVEPSTKAVKLSHELGADAVEFHTGRYCLAAQGGFGARSQAKAMAELVRLKNAALLAHSIGIHPHAGHGFDYENVRPVVDLAQADGTPLIEEYNIGHAIVCRAVVVGFERAVREMVSALQAP
jgi:pyridoxine 5-phosphate synthase